MKRSIVTALCAATVVVLAGCSSTGGTAATETAAPTSASAAGSSTPAGGSTSAPTSAPTSTADSSSSEAISEATSESTSESTETAASSAATESTDSTGLDEQTTAWFETFCGAQIPPYEVRRVQSEIDPSDPKGTLQTISELVTTAGEKFTDGAEALKDAPSPTFDGGEEFAAKEVAMIEKLGTKFLEIGKTISEIEPGDPSALQQLSTLPADLQAAGEPIQEFATLPSDVQRALLDIPACAKLAN